MKSRRVMSILLTAALSAETMFAPLSVLASSDVVPQSSDVVESGSDIPVGSNIDSVIDELPEVVSDLSKGSSELPEVISELPEGNSEVSSVLPELSGEGSGSLLPETESSAVVPAGDEMTGQEEAGPVWLEEKMLLASIDEEKEEITLSFSAFSETEKYTYEVLDKDGVSLKNGELEVQEKEVNGDLEEVFGEEDNYEARVALESSWPEELTLYVYDAENTFYITCSLQQKKAVDSIAAEQNEEDKIAVVWTTLEDSSCDGYVVELLSDEGQLVDSVTVENTISACSFKASAENLSVQVTPYVQEEDSAPEYFIGAVNAVSLLSVQEEPVAVAQMEAESMIVYPDQVGGVSAVAGDHQVTLNWWQANNAEAYNVYRWDPAGWTEYLTTVTTPNCTVTNLRGNVEYWFVIEGVRNEGGQQIKGAMSAPVNATPFIIAPNAPYDFSGVNGNGATTLTWSPNGIADGYIVYSYDYSRNQYVEIGKTIETRFTDKGAGNVDKHKYMVKAYRTDDNVNFFISDGGPETLVYGNKTVETAKSIHPIYYSARITRKTGLYAEFRKDKTKQGTLKKGEKVTIIYRRWKQSLVSYKGKKYYVYNGAMRVTGQSYTKKDYSTQEKEYYVNSQGYKSSSKYLIWISTYTQRINVFQGSKGKWKLIKSEQCVTGKIATYTPMGTFKLYKKKKAHYYGRSFYKYLCYFSGDNKMHTRPARRATKKYIDSRLGIPLSNGCVRLTDGLAKWIYNEVPKKSTVVVR